MDPINSHFTSVGEITHEKVNGVWQEVITPVKVINIHVGAGREARQQNRISTAMIVAGVALPILAAIGLGVANHFLGNALLQLASKHTIATIALSGGVIGGMTGALIGVGAGIRQKESITPEKLKD